MHYLEVIQPDSREVAEAFYRRQLKDKIPNTYFEFPSISHSGKTIWLGQNVQLVVKDGEISGFQAVARDISDRKKMEKELLRSEERHRLLVENTMDGYFICEIPSERFEFLNQKACELYGYSLQEGLNLTVWDVMSEDGHERAYTPSYPGSDGRQPPGL